MIKEILDRVEANLLATLADLGERTVPSFGLGEQALAELDSTPRVIWVPRGGQSSEAKKNGGDLIRWPGALWSRAVMINAHIWHDDVVAAEVLANHIVAALHFCCGGGAYAILGETWNTAGTTAEGVLLTLDFQLRMPFTREMPTTVRPTSVAITPHFEAS